MKSVGSILCHNVKFSRLKIILILRFLVDSYPNFLSYPTKETLHLQLMSSNMYGTKKKNNILTRSEEYPQCSGNHQRQHTSAGVEVLHPFHQEQGHGAGRGGGHGL